MENFHCDICGKGDLVPSWLALAASYGSIHDGERIRLKLCGDCADQLFYSISEHKAKIVVSG